MLNNEITLHEGEHICEECGAIYNESEMREVDGNGTAMIASMINSPLVYTAVKSLNRMTPTTTPTAKRAAMIASMNIASFANTAAKFVGRMTATRFIQETGVMVGVLKIGATLAVTATLLNATVVANGTVMMTNSANT